MFRPNTTALGTEVDSSISTMETQLRVYGWILSTTEFHDLLNEILVQLFPNWTAAELFDHTQELQHFCDAVRWHSRCFTLPDQLILAGFRVDLQRPHEQG